MLLIHPDFIYAWGLLQIYPKVPWLGRPQCVRSCYYSPYCPFTCHFPCDPLHVLAQAAIGREEQGPLLAPRCVNHPQSLAGDCFSQNCIWL